MGADRRLAAIICVLALALFGLEGNACRASEPSNNLVWQTSSTSNWLVGVAFAADGRHGWAVGYNGTILSEPLRGMGAEYTLGPTGLRASSLRHPLPRRN
jgi:photosystem II stability/assembly factor-like uncharacterized protein